MVPQDLAKLQQFDVALYRLRLLRRALEMIHDLMLDDPANLEQVELLVFMLEILSAALDGECDQLQGVYFSFKRNAPTERKG